MQTSLLSAADASVSPESGVVISLMPRHISQRDTPEALSARGIENTLRAGSPLILGYSAGKDSSCLLNLVLSVAIQLKAEGIRTPIIVTHSNTLVENPEIERLALSEIRKIREYMRKEGIEGLVMVGTPALSQSWAVRVIGGRALPPFPDGRRDCTSDWKIRVSENNLRDASKHYEGKGFAEPVVCTGVRLGESIARDQAIKDRGERADKPWRNDEGRLMLSPILHWSLDDVWEYLGYCNAGVYKAYSDFEDTLRVYRDGGGTSCSVVSDMAMAKFAKPCSSRFGCWTCTAVAKDRSLANMIEQDMGRYGYMQPLAKLRDFIADTQYDWSRRQFVHRTILDGYITVGPDAYSPSMLAELLRYTLTAQVESGVEVISEPMLLLIDARWSLYGLHPPFEAVRIWLEVMRDGKRFDPPKYDKPFPKTPPAKIGKIFVGNDWDDELSPMYADGLRSPVLELFSESCGHGLRTFANGKVGLDVPEGLEVDEEGALDFMTFMAEEKAAEPITPRTRWIDGYLYYLGLGVIQPGVGQSSTVDKILRRSNWRQDKNVHGSRSIDELYERCDVKFPRQSDMFATAHTAGEDEFAFDGEQARLVA
jgi:DNA sulfur modification protein DndC